MSDLATRRSAIQALIYSGVWAISLAGKQRLKAVAAATLSPDWSAPADDTRYDQRSTKISNGVAVIPFIGVLTKYASFYDRWWDVVSSEWLCRELDAAIADPLVTRIVLLIDSPGGMVAGTSQVAAKIRNSPKRVDAVVSDTCCSAALWIAVQCETITANAAADIGSIGVLCMGMDDSKFWEELGITFRGVDSGGVKGAGADHVIDDQVLAEWQRSVNDLFSQFKQVVAVGRDLSIDEVSRLADGRVHRAAEAKALGLIDDVADVEDALGAIQKESFMDQATFNAAATANPAWLAALTTAAVATAVADATKPKAATLDELQKEFAGDQNAAFVLNQLKVGASMSTAIAAHRTALQGEVTTLKAELERVKGQLAEHEPSSAGMEKPLNTAGGKPGSGASGGGAGKSLLSDNMDALAKERAPRR